MTNPHGGPAALRGMKPLRPLMVHCIMVEPG